MMFPGGLERALGITEISEWFDWMRREIPNGGIVLPNEEAAAAFAGHALRLRDRIRDVYRHLPASLEGRLIESVIVYQCWKLHKNQYGRAEWGEARRTSSLITVEAERYMRPAGANRGRHFVEGRDGFPYLITVPTGFKDETLPATQMICNRLAGLVGLAVPDTAVVSVRRNLLPNQDTRPGRQYATQRPIEELCAGFRCVESRVPAELPRKKSVPLDRRYKRQLIGALVFDAWTLNSLPREFSPGRPHSSDLAECSLDSCGGGLFAGDWQRFLNSTHESVPGPHAVAMKVKAWKEVSPWITKIFAADLNPIWELAFHMPPLWYGGCRVSLSRVLDKLGKRQWEVNKALHYFTKVGYLPEMRIEPWPRTMATLREQKSAESA